MPPSHGIPEAIERTTGRCFHQDAIDNQPMPFNRHDLRCGQCSAGVTAVTSFTRRNGSSIAAQF